MKFVLLGHLTNLTLNLRTPNVESTRYKRALLGTNCEPCAIRSDCTNAKSRTVYRFSNQQWRDQYEMKMKSTIGKKKMIQRKALSEHPFGTIKYWMGHIPLKTRGLKSVSNEIRLYSLCYNLKRLMNVETFDRLKKLLLNMARALQDWSWDKSCPCSWS